MFGVRGSGHKPVAYLFEEGICGILSPESWQTGTCPLHARSDGKARGFTVIGGQTDM